MPALLGSPGSVLNLNLCGLNLLRTVQSAGSGLHDLGPIIKLRPQVVSRQP